MSSIYDNWERLVHATLDREKLRQLARLPSMESNSSNSSSFSVSPYNSQFNSVLDCVSGSLMDQVIKAAGNTVIFNQECLEIKSKAENLAGMLRQAASASNDLYDYTELVLEKALELMTKCSRSSNSIPADAFQDMSSLLENSIEYFILEGIGGTMGAVCSGGRMKRNMRSMGSFGKNSNHDDSYRYPDEIDGYEKSFYDSGELHFSISRELKPPTPARTPAGKAPHATSFLGKAGSVGLEKAVDILDTLARSVKNLNTGGFTTGVTSRGNKISILAFEVANTIAKGSNLFQSLSEEKIQFLKKEILHSDGVRKLVSTDMNELLRIAAADKREEFEVFSREVIRLGKMCIDPQWHNLGGFFAMMDSNPDTNKQPREKAEMTMQEPTTLARHTSEFYHELHALDRFEQDYKWMLEEVESLHLPKKGDGLSMLLSELKHQRKIVRSLKKKSLWFKNLEQVVEMLVDIVMFIHQGIFEAFGDNGFPPAGKASFDKPEKLGVAGLALHYANIINQIDDILTYPQIKAEMEKTLKWLVPVAMDTTKAHQGFGWVREWANTGNDFGKTTGTQNSVIRLQTLYHADKRKVDHCILELVTWLHRLINLVRYRDNGIKAMRARFPSQKGPDFSPQTPNNNENNNNVHKIELASEDKNLLEEVKKTRKLAPRLSKIQEFVMSNVKMNKFWALSKNMGSSPRRRFTHQKGDILDVLDGLDSKFVDTSREEDPR